MNKAFTLIIKTERFILGVGFAFLTALSFSFSNILVKKGMKYSENDNGVWMTVLVNFVLLGIVALLYRFFIVAETITFVGTLFFVLAGALTSFLGRTTLFHSFRYIGPSRGIAIKNSAPLFTVIFALIILGERISLIPLLGMLLVFVGLAIQAVFMVKHGSNLTNEEKIERTGYFFALLAALVFGIGQGLRGSGLEMLSDPFYGAFIGAAVAFLLTSLVEVKKGNFKEKISKQFTQFNTFYFFAGILSSIAVLSFFIAITYIQVSYVAVIAAVEPLLTIALSFLLLKEEKIKRYTVVVASVVFSGVICIVLFR